VLVLQVLEITGRVVLCVNLMDEPRSRGVHIDTDILSEKLGIPVCGISAASGMGMEKLRCLMVEKPCSFRREIPMPDTVISSLEELSDYLTGQPLPHGWLARSLVEGDPGLCDSLMHRLCLNPHKDLELDKLIDTARENLRNQGYTPEQLGELAAETASATAHEVAAAAVHREKPESHNLSRRLDSVLTHPVYGIPVMVKESRGE
jgi:ferrous iron transport protein B